MFENIDHCLGFSQSLAKMQICIKILSINFELSAHLETMPDRILILNKYHIAWIKKEHTGWPKKRLLRIFRTFWMIFSKFIFEF